MEWSLCMSRNRQRRTTFQLRRNSRSQRIVLPSENLPLLVDTIALKRAIIFRDTTQSPPVLRRSECVFNL
jgi:hypothetical protein